MSLDSPMQMLNAGSRYAKSRHPSNLPTYLHQSLGKCQCEQTNWIPFKKRTHSLSFFA